MFKLIPLDTAKVRLQLQKKAVAGDGIALPKYKGMLGTVGTIAREEGLASLRKGIVPNFGRLGSWNVIMFLTLECHHVSHLDHSLSIKALYQISEGSTFRMLDRQRSSLKALNQLEYNREQVQLYKITLIFVLVFCN
ncbi:mitochondrial uncoupling protein 1 [Tanacetum coccineum]